MRKVKSFNNSGAEQEGFTVIELMIAFLILAIAGALAVPRITELRPSFDRMNTRSNLVQDLKRAQAESLTQGCRGIFTIFEGGTGYSFGCDYLPYDANVPPTADQISFIRFFPNGINMTTSGDIIFSSRGETIDTDGIITSVNLSLLRSEGGGQYQFLTGTLLGTGMFALD